MALRLSYGTKSASTFTSGYDAWKIFSMSLETAWPSLSAGKLASNTRSVCGSPPLAEHPVSIAVIRPMAASTAAALPAMPLPLPVGAPTLNGKRFLGS